MKPEQWQQAREVLADALELKPEDRPAFLDRVCSSDNSLRREVERLLSSSGDAQSSFLQSSALRVTLMPGAKLGEYEVQKLIGSGGMGEVYRARDRRLGREVAIKVLPSFLSRDPDRLRRFEQEARAAAALNHPNILAVHQLGTFDGAPYLVSELLEGGTLREQLVRGPMPLRKAIDYGVQIARGLAAAHEKGIVHRDLKPENLFVAKDGRVKILDFGLAKLVQRPTTFDHSAPTASEGTEPGVVMGTVGYMSPEQVCGNAADHRADIFAFGAILYEMLAGKRAFQKPTSAETMSAILNEDPPGISQLAPNVPLALQRVVHRCLEKNPEQRFQSASDLAFALEALSDSGSSTSAVVQPHTRATGMWLSVSLVVVAVLVSGALLWFSRSGRVARSQWMQLTNLPDAATQPMLSPDGRMLAFIRGPNTFIGQGELYVKMLPDGEPFQLTHDGSRKMGPVFSPDGSRIAYTVLGNRNTWDTWVVPVLGGKPELWFPNAAGLVWIDAHRLLFSEIKRGQHMTIATSLESRAETRDVYVPPNEDAMAHRSYISPDGRWVVLAEMNQYAHWLPCRLVPFDGTSMGHTVGPAGAPCTSAAWSPDGKWMYLSINAGDNYHIWRQRFPDSPAEQLTTGPTDEEGIAIGPDGRSLITSVGLRERPIWFHDAGGDHQISLEGYAVEPRLFANGKKIAYTVSRRGATNLRQHREIWVSDLDSKHTEPLLPGFEVTQYDVSSDGRFVFSSLDTEGKSRLWLAWADRRSPPVQIPSVEGDWPLFGPQGDIYFLSLEGKLKYLFRVSQDGTVPKKINPYPAFEAQGLSPDGAWVAAYGAIPGEVGSFAFAYPNDGGRPVRLCNPPCRVQWAPGGKFVYFLIASGWMNFGATGRTYVVPTRPGTMLPSLPPGGFQSEAQLAAVPGVRIIEAADVSPGRGPDKYVFSRELTQRNLYRIPLP